MERTPYVFTKHDHATMEICHILAKKSTCKRAKVGAVIALDEGTFITGYNGTLKGFPNNCDDEALVCTACNVVVSSDDYVEGEQHCKKGIIEKRPKSNSSVIHAEPNAIMKAAKLGISISDKTMYVTTSPCINCANIIVQSGITRVIYDELHDVTEGIDILKQAGVMVVKYVPIGKISQWSEYVDYKVAIGRNRDPQSSWDNKDFFAIKLEKTHDQNNLIVNDRECKVRMLLDELQSELRYGVTHHMNKNH